MTKKGYFKDARLLEALEYIDQDLVGEVAVKLKFDETAPLTEEPVMTWRTPFKHWKRMIAAVACLILLSCAIPIINYVLPRIGIAIGGNAGAGSSDVELNEYGSPYERAIDAYPADMPADEIYADVLKGGWVVVQDSKCEIITAVELWQEFINAVEAGKECSVLIAYYSDHVTIKFVGADDEQYAGISQIVLAEVKYDGNKFVKSTKWFHPDYKNFYSSEYSYLLNERNPFTDRTTYYLADKPDQRLNDIRYSSEKVSMDSAIIVGDGLITIWEH